MHVCLTLCLMKTLRNSNITCFHSVKYQTADFYLPIVQIEREENVCKPCAGTALSLTQLQLFASILQTAC